MVSKKLADGHICIRLADINTDFDEDAYYPGYRVAEIKDLARNPFISTSPETVQPFILFKNKLYLQRYFRYETMILDKVRSLIETEAELLLPRMEELLSHKAGISELLDGSTAGLAKQFSWQTAAAISAALNNFTIITGGPGTGKTTTVARLLAVLLSINPSLQIALAAPTGKAAARMAESLKTASLPGLDSGTLFAKLQPSTIHRLLGTVPASTSFRHNAANPLHFDVVIIDESSMIDVAMFAKLLEAIGPSTRLIMLGDKDQLASVEAGSLFGDLCQSAHSINWFSQERAEFINSFLTSEAVKLSGAETSATGGILAGHIIELQHSHRFSDEEGIGRFSKAVIRNDVPVITDFIDNPNDAHVFIDLSDSQEQFHEFIRGYEEYIAEQDMSLALRKLNKLRVLCAVREGDQGLYTLNRQIEEYLRRKGFIKQAGDFYEHRPVMITRNNYRLGLYNGDTGILRYDEQGVLRAWFENADGGLVSVLPIYLSHIETVFAMTIHKSQGSEFDSVMVVLPPASKSTLLTRELLYTAVTRAKKKVVIRAAKETILETANRQVDRGSGITDRLQDIHPQNY